MTTHSKRLKAGDHINCNVAELGENGLGMADGSADCTPAQLSVENGLPGESGTALVLGTGKHRAHLRLMERDRDAPERRSSLPCPRWTPASPCRVMHLSDAAQLEFKTERVRRAFLASGLPTHVVEETRPAPRTLGWRTRVTYVVRRRDGQMVLGAYQRGTHVIQEMDPCPLEDAAISQARDALRAALEELEIPSADAPRGFAYDNGCGSPASEATLTKNLHRPKQNKDRGDTTHFKDGLRYVTLRANGQGQVLAVLLTPSGVLLGARKVAELARQIFPRFAGIFIGRSGPGDKIYGEGDTKSIGASTPLEENVSGVSVRISPKAFFQVNRTAAESLRAYVTEQLAPPGEHPRRVLELYAGVGVLSLELASRGHTVLGVEAVPEAVRDAEDNARRNAIESARFLCMDSGAAFTDPLLSSAFDGVIMNPPRKGCDPSVLDGVIRSKAPRLVYISCNPVTLARDLKPLINGGYSLSRVTPFDLIPHSEHVECVAVLSRTTQDPSAV